MRWVIILIFCIQWNINESCQLIISVLYGVVRHIRVYPQFFKVTNCQYFGKVLTDYLTFLNAVRHTWNLQIDLVILIGCYQACSSVPKVLQITNYQYLSIELIDWLGSLHVVRHTRKLWIDPITLVACGQICSGVHTLLWNTKLPIFFFIFYFLFNWLSLHARLNSHYKAWSYKKKEHKKIKTYRKHAVNRCLLILDYKPLRSLVKGKHFYRKRIPDPSCARKETVDIGHPCNF